MTGEFLIGSLGTAQKPNALPRTPTSPWNDVIDFGSIHNNFKQPQYECVPTNPTTGERAGPWSCIQSPKDHKSWIIARRVRGGASKPLDDVEGLVIEETWEGKGGFWSSTREGCLLGLQYYVDRQVRFLDVRFKAFALTVTTHFILQTDEPFRCSEGGYNWDPPHWCKVGRMGLPPPNDTNVPCADGTTWTQPTYLPKGTNNSWEVVSKLKTGTTTTPIEIAADPYNGIPQAQITFSYKTGATSRYIAPKTTTTSTWV